MSPPGAAVVLALAAAARAATFTAAPARDLQPLFAQAPAAGAGVSVWLGGDVATSLPLDDAGHAHLWLFGDTIIGHFSANGTRTLTGMPRNSVGVLYTRGDGSPLSTLSHAWRLDAAHAQHVGFFSPSNASLWYWPTAGVRVQNATTVVAMRMENAGSGLFPFQLVSYDAITLPAFGDGTGAGGDPAEWPSPLPASPIGGAFVNPNLTIGNAVTDGGDGYVYLLGGVGSPSAAMMVRVSYADWAARAWAGLRFLCADGGWRAHAPDLPIARLFDGVPSETTMTYVPAAGAWLLPVVNTFESRDVRARTAPALSGPWSDPVALFTIPPAFLDGGAFCYAGKVHPEFTAPGGADFVLTYNCNTDGLGPLANRPDAYIPQVMRVTVS